MTNQSFRTVVAGAALALLVTGCVTSDPKVQPPSSAAYAPTEQTGKSSEQLRAELESSLKQTERLVRVDPFYLANNTVERVEVGEDYAYIKFKHAEIPVTEAWRDEFDTYAFRFDQLSDLTIDGKSCWSEGAPLPDRRVKFSAPLGYQFCDVIYTLGRRARQQREADRARFAQLAALYRGRAPAPVIPEDLRRLIVQAEVLRQERNYIAAAATFRKVVRQEPVAYPAAYFNLALLYEAQKDFPNAIESMKRYLLLRPQAPDARAAQDKIYEWEMKADRR